MRLTRNPKGMTLIETLFSVTLISMAGVALLAILMSSLKGWCSGTSRDSATDSATIASEKLANDIRDAKAAVVSSDYLTLTVTFPKKVIDVATNETIYDLSADDPVTRSYYISNGNLVRKLSTGQTSILARGVSVPDSTKQLFGALNGEVNVVLKGKQQVGNNTSEQEVTTRITLRNYKSL